ncbi:ABC transporter permease [Herbaspirillum sp. alder98]|uniref:ABC transporter permease n=1 Tax=Herbaspirillum sp. alder98 TaxID=2913096 RepID=UPI001CD84843|nr:ABC transporter permease [Herbaspirillum sp. alder98]MCA1325628.1 ABC transporter permease [Herbaspirillum sp. alder98]
MKASAAEKPLKKPGSSLWLRIGQDFMRNRIAVAGLALLLLLIAAALLAPWITPQNPYDLNQLDVMNSHLHPGAVAEGLNYRFWLGTDDQGRDIYSGIVYGLRISLTVGLVSTGIALLIGVTLGLLAAYFGGWLDGLLMRIVDMQLSFPAMLIALILVALLGSGLDKVIIALVAVQWAYYARTVRSAALIEKQREYIEAAKSLGLSNARVVFSHLLPNCIPPIIVVATMNIATAISLEATLAFLGVGAPITEPSLGRLIANGYSYMLSGEYWICFFPGVMLLILIMSINLVGDHLRDVLNPRLQK